MKLSKIIESLGNKIAYTGIIIDGESRNKILQNLIHEKVLNEDILQDFEIVAHHMTIKLGPLVGVMKYEVGKRKELKVEGYAKNNKVVAVSVSGYMTQKEQAHITVAINKKEGGRAQHSNDLREWTKLSKPFSVSGIIREVPHA
jgi:hypothetical protein